MSIYFNNPWKPAPQTIIKDKVIKKDVEEIGFHIKDILSFAKIEKLLELYNKYHHIKAEKGGMFYSIYSQDLEYRKNVSKEIKDILSDCLDAHLKDFKEVLFSFVVKFPGKNSEFYLHQDTTGLDEHKYSALNLWIPLDDVENANGCLNIVPKSHKWFSPYRSISFPAPFDNIQATVKKYLQPLEMQKGEVLFFDSRLLHNSSINYSNKARIAVVCGLFPKEAELITCFKEKYELGGQVEFIKHNDNFLNEGVNFFIDCQKRPEFGSSIAFTDDLYPEISATDFVKLCKENNIQKNDIHIPEETKCDLFGEPTEKKGLFINERLNAELRELGVVKIPFLTAQEVEELNSFENEIHPKELPNLYDNIYMTTWCEDLDYKLKIKAKIESIFKTKYDDLFKNYRSCNHVFIIKNPAEETQFNIHQDWSMVDESKYESVNIWVPLQDVDETNGAMYIIHKSHKIESSIRGAGDLFPDYMQYFDELKPFMTQYKLKAGEALVFYHNTIHGSPANISSKKRIVAASSILPKQAKMLINYHKPDSKIVKVIQTKDDVHYYNKKLREESVVFQPKGAVVKEIPFNKIKTKNLEELIHEIK